MRIMNFAKRQPMDPEAARVARLRTLQQQKAAAVAELLPRYRAAIAQADELERGIDAAQEAVEAAMRAYTAACLDRSRANEEYQQALASIEYQMRELRDPLIDAFRCEIDERLLAASKIPCAMGDSKRDRITALEQHLLSLRDTCDRLEVDEHVTDVAGYLDQLRANIPTV